jgi:hypothetical protein
MRAMRDMCKARPTPLIQFVSNSQEKQWGDWEMVKTVDSYKKGRINQITPRAVGETLLMIMISWLVATNFRRCSWFCGG